MGPTHYGPPRPIRARGRGSSPGRTATPPPPPALPYAPCRGRPAPLLHRLPPPSPPPAPCRRSSSAGRAGRRRRLARFAGSVARRRKPPPRGAPRRRGEAKAPLLIANGSPERCHGMEAEPLPPAVCHHRSAAVPPRPLPAGANQVHQQLHLTEPHLCRRSPLSLRRRSVARSRQPRPAAVDRRWPNFQPLHHLPAVGENIPVLPSISSSLCAAARNPRPPERRQASRPEPPSRGRK